MIGKSHPYTCFGFILILFSLQANGQSIILARPTVEDSVYMSLLRDSVFSAESANASKYGPFKGEITTTTAGNTLQELGIMVSGTSLTTSHLFENTGTHPLKVIAGKSPCACLKVSPTQLVIAPGQKGFFNIRYQSGLDRTGIRVHTLRFKSNTDPQVSSFTLVAEVVESGVPR